MHFYDNIGDGYAQLHVTCIIILLSNIATESIDITEKDLITNQANRAEFTCSVCPTLAPLFMWNFTKRGGFDMEIIANRSLSLSPEYSLTTGQKSQALIIGDAQWSHVGVYKCIASVGGTIIEAEASLDVLSKPYHVVWLKRFYCSYYPSVVPLSNMVIRGSNSSPARQDTVGKRNKRKASK